MDEIKLNNSLNSTRDVKDHDRTASPGGGYSKKKMGGYVPPSFLKSGTVFLFVFFFNFVFVFCLFCYIFVCFVMFFVLYLA